MVQQEIYKKGVKLQEKERVTNEVYSNEGEEEGLEAVGNRAEDGGVDPGVVSK
jgi:hypothetical protein